MEVVNDKKIAGLSIACVWSALIVSGCSNQIADDKTSGVSTNEPIVCCNPAPPVVGDYNNTPPAQPETPVVPVDGRPSVQVIAAAQFKHAQQMFDRMQADGYNPVIVEIDGLYKVRIPYNSYGEAKANLEQIRWTVPDAFVAMR